MKAKDAKQKDTEGPDDVDEEALTGRKFAVTGVFENITRDELEKFINNKGGRVTSAVSGVTDYLVAGHKLEDGREVDTSGKYKKASKLSVKIVSETEFEEEIRKITGLEKFKFGTDLDIFEAIAEEVQEEEQVQEKKGPTP